MCGDDNEDPFACIGFTRSFLRKLIKFPLLARCLLTDSVSHGGGGEAGEGLGSLTDSAPPGVDLEPHELQLLHLSLQAGGGAVRSGAGGHTSSTLL